MSFPSVRIGCWTARAHAWLKHKWPHQQIEQNEHRGQEIECGRQTLRRPGGFLLDAGERHEVHALLVAMGSGTTRAQAQPFSTEPHQMTFPPACKRSTDCKIQVSVSLFFSVVDDVHHRQSTPLDLLHYHRSTSSSARLVLVQHHEKRVI